MNTLVNGRPADNLAVADRGLHYGDGLFETLAIRHGQPLLWERHMQRLRDGCTSLGLTAPDDAQVHAEVMQVAGHAPRAVVKIILTRGSAGRGYRPPTAAVSTRIIQHHPWPQHPPAAREQGVAVRWCQTRLSVQPRLAGLKHLNRLEQVLARAEWQDEYAEGLTRNTRDLVIEATASNLFLVHEGTLITPDLSQSGVAGVMRAEVLAQARRCGIPVAIQAVTPAMVEQAEALFLTNSLIGIWPVNRLETRRYEVAGKITQTLQTALQAANVLA